MNQQVLLIIKVKKKIIDELKLLKGKITIIFVTHRTSALTFCDNIMEIKDGKINDK